MQILEKGKQQLQVDTGEPSWSSPNKDDRIRSMHPEIRFDISWKQPLKENTRMETGGPSQDPNRKLNLVQDQIARDEYLATCVPLYKAARKGDWKAAKKIIDKNELMVIATLTNKLEIALHIAVTGKHTVFVRNLIERMSPSDLAIQNVDDNTALHFAAASGVLGIAKMMIDKNEDLPMIKGSGRMTPLYMAALFGNREMVIYLNKETKVKYFTDEALCYLFHAMIKAEIFDVALEMLKDEGGKSELLALFHNDIGETALHLLACKPFAVGHRKELNMFQKLPNFLFKGSFHDAKMRTFAHQLVGKLWNLIVKFPMKPVSVFLETNPKVLFKAAQLGNVHLLDILIRSYPDLIWNVDEKNRSLFHIAAVNRHEKIFNKIYELGAIKDLISVYTENESENNLLHLVARLPPPNRLQVVSGAALQMQRELLWFKAVKQLVPREYIDAENIDGEVAQDIFTKEHENLRKEGEKWMKETAAACMLAATLIATMVLAAAFALPGGNDDGGFPKFQKMFWFEVFIFSDSVSLLSSVISIVIFLSILTSRYAEDDFRTKLPTKLMFGLLTLCVSIISMVLAFTATIILIRYKESKWSVILVVCLAFFTPISFIMLHIHLLFDTIHSFIKLLVHFFFHRHKIGIYL